MEQLRHIMVRVLRRAEDFGFLLCFFALLLVETGYVAWLERLPTFPAPEQPAPLSLCLSSTDGLGLSNALTDGAWGHDRVERVEPSGLFPKQARGRRNRRRSATLVIYRLKRAAFWAALTGAELLAIQPWR
jgi:hypothetical protein